MTTGKTIALTRWTFVDKVMSLLFNMLSTLVINFLPKEQVSFNFVAAVTICSDFGAQKNKVRLSYYRSSFHFADSVVAKTKAFNFDEIHFIVFRQLCFQCYM